MPRQTPKASCSLTPDGTGDPRGWYTGFGAEGVIDDVGWIGALIDTVSARYRVDRGRVYVVGHSNGGVLAHRAASDLSTRIAASAVVAGAIGVRSGMAPSRASRRRAHPCRC